MKHFNKTKRLALISSIMVMMHQAYAQSVFENIDDETVVQTEEVLPATPFHPGGQKVYKRTKAKYLKAAAYHGATKQEATESNKEATLTKQTVTSNIAEPASLNQKTDLPSQTVATQLAPSSERTKVESTQITVPAPSSTSPSLIVKAENVTGREQALLDKIKAEKLIKQSTQPVKTNLTLNNLSTTQNPSTQSQSSTEDELRYNLAPGESVIKNQREKAKPVKQLPKSAEDIFIDKLEFTQANILDVSRALADISGLNFVATEEAAKKNVTVFLQNITVKNALEAITKNAGLWYRRDKESGTFRIMSTEEYQRDLVVYREDTTRVFNLFNNNPILIATAVRDLYGERVILSYGSDYDDFNTGSFNGGGNQGIQNNQGNQNNRNIRNGAGGSPGGAALGNGQNSLRRPITTGNTTTNALRANNNGQANKFDEKISGTSGNGAITEKLTADQLSKLESVTQLDADGNLIVSDAIRGITRAQQPIYITISRQQNMMIVRTSDNVAVKEIENLVKAMDKPTEQVLLEMQILEVDVGDDYKQLFSFSAFSKNQKNRTFGIENDDEANTGKFVYQFVDSLIRVKLELLERNKKAKTISSPVLLASNNRTARLFVGEERLLVRGATLTDAVLGNNGFIVTPARITYETEIRNIGDTLNITPKINNDGTVTLGIFQDTSTVNRNAANFPPLVQNGILVNVGLDTVLTANIEGVVAAKDGLTVAIGGLIRTSVSKDESKIPVLGDLPVLGNLFKDKLETASRKELILLITPHIIKSPAESDDVSRDTIEPLTDYKW